MTGRPLESLTTASRGNSEEFTVTWKVGSWANSPIAVARTANRNALHRQCVVATDISIFSRQSITRATNGPERSQVWVVGSFEIRLTNYSSGRSATAVAPPDPRFGF